MKIMVIVSIIILVIIIIIIVVIIMVIVLIVTTITTIPTTRRDDHDMLACNPKVMAGYLAQRSSSRMIVFAQQQDILASLKMSL